MKNSRAKGAVGELELADTLCKAGMLARRTVQYNGKMGAADVLIEGTEIHVEVKRAEAFRLKEWIDQCERDCKGRPWVLIIRQSRQPWIVVQGLDQWTKDSIEAGKARAHRQAIIDHVEASCEDVQA